jgi:hypothetical protein
MGDANCIREAQIACLSFMDCRYIIASFCRPCPVNANAKAKEETPGVMIVRFGPTEAMAGFYISFVEVEQR